MFIADMFTEDQGISVIVTYPGRFQPFHKGHLGVYSKLQAQFGAKNVYIQTSNDTSSDKSPFNFSDKVQLITAMGITQDRIIQSNQMYKPPEGIAPERTIFVTAVGAPDAKRLNPDSVKKNGSPGYFKNFEDLSKCTTADKHGYVVVVPELQESVTVAGQQYDVSHGTDVRNLWNQVRTNPEQRKEFIVGLYGAYNESIVKIFEKIPTMKTEDITEAQRSQSARRKENCWPGYKKVGTKPSPTHGKSVRVNDCEKIKESVTEGSGSNYAEQLAQQIFNKRQDITSEDEILNQAYHIVANDLGQKSARYMFNYDADFPSDLVSSYFYLQKQGVAEGQLNELLEPTLNYYKLSNGKTVQASYRPNINQSPIPFTDVKVSYVNPALKPQGGSFDSTGVAEPWTNAPDGVKQAIEKFVTNPQSGTSEGVAVEPDPKGYQKDLLTTPKNSLVIDTPGDLDWYKLGQHYPTLGTDDPHEYGQGDSDMVIVPYSKQEQMGLKQKLDRLKMKYKDIGGGNQQPEIHSNNKEGNLKELSTDKLAQYKKAAGADAKKADASGDFKRGDKRFSGIVKATNKQFDNDLKKHGQKDVAEGSQRVDSLVTDALKIMRGSDVNDAVAALKIVLGNREFNDRRGHYNFYVRQLVDMYSQQGMAETKSAHPQQAAIAIAMKKDGKKPKTEGVGENDTVQSLVNIRSTVKQIQTGKAQYPQGFASQLEVALYDAINALRNNPEQGAQNTVNELANLRAIAKQVQTGKATFPQGYTGRLEWVLYDAIKQIENSSQGVAEAGYRRDAYQRDYDSSVAGMGKRQSYAYRQDGGGNDERRV